MTDRPYEPMLATLVARQSLSPNMARLTFRGEALKAVARTLLDQRIKLVLGEVEQLTALLTDAWYEVWLALPDQARPAIRTYTLRDVRYDVGEVDIDFVVHGDTGPATRFASRAELGSTVLLVLPMRDHPDAATVGLAWHPGAATELLIAGDETALPAIANIVTTLPPEARGTVLVEIPALEDAYELRLPEGMTVTWCPRRGGVGDALLTELGDCLGQTRVATEDVTEPGPDDIEWNEAPVGCSRYGWIAGEAGWVRRARAMVKSAELGDKVSCMGYWREGSSVG